MSKKSIKILAIESSCDETSASLVHVTYNTKHATKIQIISNVVSSQVKLHAKYGGVYPELASREHIRNILPVIEKSITGISNFQFLIFNETQNSNVLKLSHSKFNKNLKFKIENSVDFIAVTTGPGLIGSLLVGVETAKTLAYVLNKPIIPVNHLEGHIYSNFVRVNPKLKTLNSKQIQNSKFKKIHNSSFIIHNSPKFPILALIVSGGHTSLVYMKNHLDYKIIGETLDDAAGEAFDKVATMLELPYPGGPEVEKQAAKFSIFNFQFSNNFQNPNDQNPKKLMKLKANEAIFNFPRPMINSKDFNFSFSGLKTAVLYAIKKLPKPLSFSVKSLICKEFQDAVVETLVTKTLRAAEKYKVKSILLGGGVAANSRLREEFTRVLSSSSRKRSASTSGIQMELDSRLRGNDKFRFFVPEKSLCTDNATVIGVAAAYKILAGKTDKWYNIRADANLQLSTYN